MKITVNSQVLATELRLLNKIVPTKPTIPILNHVLIEANDGLSFWATDMELGLSCGCAAKVQEPGAVALPVARLLALVDQFTNGDVVITSDKGHVTVVCGAFKSRLQAYPADDFPNMPTIDGESNVLSGNEFKQLITRTSYAVSATTSKYVLKGALLTFAGSVAAMVATDGKRLAIATASRTGTNTQFIIPLKTLDLLPSHISGDCEVTASEKYLFFMSGGRLLTSRVIDGAFPKYERIIPRDNTLVVTTDRAMLTAALRRVVLVAEESCTINFDIVPGQLTLSTSSAEVGSADECFTVKYDGPPIVVQMNGNFVLEFLAVASSPIVTLALKDTNTAALFSDGDSHVAVIMLMRA